MNRFIRRKKKRSELLKQLTCKNTDCYPFPHRMGGGNCKFTRTGEYKDGPIVYMLPEPDDYPF